MPDFAYTARDIDGQKVEGTISAATKREAVSALSVQSLFPLNVALDKPGTQFNWRRRIRGELKATTFAQMAALLRSGVPVLRTLDVLRGQTSHPTLREVLEDVHRRVEDGASLADAASHHPTVFSPMAVGMIRAGGEGGFLEEALDRVATFTERQQDLVSRTTGALIYPAVLGITGVVVVTTLLVFFVPSFEAIFDDLRSRGELPVATEWLLATSSFLERWGILLLGAIVALGIYLWTVMSTDRGMRVVDSLKLRLPMVGPIFQNLAVARFCRVLGTLLGNGVPIIRSLEISEEASGNRVLAEAISDAAENITSGDSLARPLAASGHFPPTVVEMIAVAEESNSLETVLVDVAEGLERRTARRLDLFVRLLEPAMLVVLASVVLVVVIALLMPVMKMGTTL